MQKILSSNAVPTSRGVEPFKPGVPLAPERLEDLKRRYLAGEKYEVISLETGLSWSTIRKYRHRLNLPSRKDKVTPEGRVKNLISRMLDRHGAYRYMPVPYGYGPTGIDYFVCHKGRFIGIEAKAPGKKPTALQDNVLARIRAAGGVTFVIDGEAGLKELETWLSGG
jgi:hypothetical protein